MLKIGIIGLGNIAATHISNIIEAENAELIAACDIDETRRECLPANVSFYTCYTDMLRRHRLDIVHICLPHYLHLPVAQAVAESGCHVLLEKPLGLTFQQAQQCTGLAQQYGVKICLCLQNRLNSTTVQLKQKLLSGEYGAVKAVHGQLAWNRSRGYYAEKPWRGQLALAGGGCMINQSIHTLDLLQYFAGSPVVRLRGQISQLRNTFVEVEDTALAYMVFANGATGLFNASVANYTDEPVSFRVQCEKAEFIIENRTLFIEQAGQCLALTSDQACTTGKACYGNSHTALIAQFYRAVQQNTNEYLHTAEGLPSMQLIDAIVQSSKTNMQINL